MDKLGKSSLSVSDRGPAPRSADRPIRRQATPAASEAGCRRPARSRSSGRLSGPPARLLAQCSRAQRVLACWPSSRSAPTSARKAMKPAEAAAAWATGVLIETSKIRSPSSRCQSSPRDRPGQPRMHDLPPPGPHRPHHDRLRVVDLLARQAEQEEHLLLGEEVGDRIAAGDHALDQPLGHGHRQRCRLHHALLACVGLDLEAAVFPPQGRNRGRVDRPELDGAVMLAADDPPGPGDHSHARTASSSGCRRSRCTARSRSSSKVVRLRARYPPACSGIVALISTPPAPPWCEPLAPAFPPRPPWLHLFRSATWAALIHVMLDLEVPFGKDVPATLSILLASRRRMKCAPTGPGGPGCGDRATSRGRGLRFLKEGETRNERCPSAFALM